MFLCELNVSINCWALCGRSFNKGKVLWRIYITSPTFIIYNVLHLIMHLTMFESSNSKRGSFGQQCIAWTRCSCCCPTHPTLYMYTLIVIKASIIRCPFLLLTIPGSTLATLRSYDKLCQSINKVEIWFNIL